MYRYTKTPLHEIIHLKSLLKMVFGLLSFILLTGFIFLGTNNQEMQTEIQCVLIQKKEIIHIPFGNYKKLLLSTEVPSFLKNANKTYCRVNRGVFRDTGLTAVNIDHPETHLEMLKCGNTDIYIKPECVCSFYNVFEASLYHGYSSCPAGAESDIVTQLKCPDCKKYSLNNNGPCINGGQLTCKEEEVAPEMTCQCPENYLGAFCENKVENITRICNRIPNESSIELENCNSTWRECVTYSRSQLHAYRCQEANASHDGQGLPLCVDTENTTPDIRWLDPNQNEPGELNYFWAELFYFILYLVLVFGVLIYLLLRILE